MPRKTANECPCFAKLCEYGGNDSRYEAWFPDFPYVVGEGLTEEEAIREARENLQAVFNAEERG